MSRQAPPQSSPRRAGATTRLATELRVFSGSANPPLAQAICRHLKIRLSDCLVSRFSEGEIRVQIQDNVRGKDVFIVQPTCPPPNDNLMELLIMLDALRRASARRITAVVPYYGYARQDRKDQPRVPITAKLVANLITTAGADRVLTMDLHAGQIQGFFDIPLDHLYAVNVFEQYLTAKRLTSLVVVSPDVGGIKTARAYAKRLGAGLAIVDKRRKTPESTEVMHILGDVEGSDCLLVDDLVATGSSLVEAANALKRTGAKRIYAAITHAVLSGPAFERIADSPLEELMVTDTIPLSSQRSQPRGPARPANSTGLVARAGLPAIVAQTGKITVLSVAALFGEAIHRIHAEESISSLFDGLPS